MYMRLASRLRYAAVEMDPCDIATATTSGSMSRVNKLTLKTDPKRNASIHRRSPGMFLLKNHTA